MSKFCLGHLYGNIELRNALMARWIVIDRWIAGQLDGWLYIDGKLDKQMNSQIDRWVARQIDGQLIRQMVGYI